MKSNSRVFLFTRYVIWVGLSVIFLTFFSCKSSTTQPDGTNSSVTSHNFSWQKIPFDHLTPNIISIVNKDDIWIAGIGNGDFSVLHWDGKTLNKVVIYDSVYQSVKKYFSDFIAFGNDDLYFADGDVFCSDGHTMRIMYKRNANENEFFRTLWMKDPSDIYASGQKSIIHFDGQHWSKIPVAGSDPVVDIWGAYPDNGGPIKLIGLIASPNGIGIRRLITIKNGTVKDTLNWPDDVNAQQLWFDSKSPIYVRGDVVWQYLNSKWQEVELEGKGFNAMHGSAWNNIFVVGSHGYAAHFNGANWHRYPELYDESGEFEAVCVKGNVVAMAGRFAPSAYLVIGLQGE